MDLADLYLAVADIKSALYHVKIGYELNPSLQILEKMARLYDVQGMIACRSGNYDRASAMFEEGISLYPSLWALWEHSAIPYISRELFDEAIPRIEKALELCSSMHSRPLLMLLSNIYLKIGQEQKAKMICRDCLTVDENYEPAIRFMQEFERRIDAFTLKASEYSMQGDNLSASRVIIDAIKAKPESVQLRCKRASYLRLAGELDKAETEMKNLLNQLGSDTQADLVKHQLALIVNHRGVQLLQQGQPNKAISTFTEALEWDPTLSVILLNRGDAHKSKAEYAAAMTDFLAALKLKPGDPPARRRIAVVHDFFALELSKVGRLDEAIQEHNSAIESSPHLPDLHLHRAETFLKLGKYKDAFDDLTFELRVSPGSIEVISRLQALLPSTAATVPTVHSSIPLPPTATARNLEPINSKPQSGRRVELRRKKTAEQQRIEDVDKVFHSFINTPFQFPKIPLSISFTPPAATWVSPQHSNDPGPAADDHRKNDDHGHHFFDVMTTTNLDFDPPLHPQDVKTIWTAKKRITKHQDMEYYHKTEGYARVLHFISVVNESLTGLSFQSELPPLHPSIPACVVVLEQIRDSTQRFVPSTDQSRYGVKEFAYWHQYVSDNCIELLGTVIGTDRREDILDLANSFLDSFGNPQRLDYGTGHEQAFVFFLTGLSHIFNYSRHDFMGIGLRIFPVYMNLAHLLQKRYRLEAAGSHGHWGLDDYQFVPFLWGSAQLIHTDIPTSSITNSTQVMALQQHDLFFDSLTHILEVKNGSLQDNSPSLAYLATSSSWSDINYALFKMIKDEVFDKYTIAQHFFFGRLIPYTLLDAAEEEKRNAERRERKIRREQAAQQT
ncbi:putative Serine/threonine-protein phosphatase 2A activator [Blattamonas nauphoetae]|uniref:peptidylprolyl isomerase n=1 Tax=Blattamonas nauphoetae TaxID=2049346 RepID=A0ABQ9YEY5_9EUKA|nr:putative Serine/threonine-protein phosphatase 2A activator [Blattamonas nauphoetae]